MWLVAPSHFVSFFKGMVYILKNFLKIFIFLEIILLAYIFNSEDDQQFIKDKINLANKLGYQAIKSPYFEDDITRILPKDLNFKNLI